jgi:hypothetical protein
MSDVLTYQDFIKISYNLDRQKYSLPKESKDIINKIKKKLNISINPDFQRIKIEKTKINKNNDELGVLYMNLNKITDKTYDKLSKEILNIIENMGLLNSEIQTNICIKFFDIISTNDYYCHLYAKLLNSIIEISPLFKNVFENKIIDYLNNFKEIKYISPNTNYDKYCDYIKSINKIKNFTIFLLKCFDENILTIDKIVNICLNFQEIIINQAIDNDKLIENENYIQNIYFIIKHCIDIMYFHNNWEFIKRNIEYIKTCDFCKNNKKIKFKLMDIEDIINKLE